MTDDITALVAEKCWQPIKTAPKDGETIVDLWFPPLSGRRTDWRWYRKRGYWGSIPVNRFCAIHTCDESPTHWMPRLRREVTNEDTV
jgi:hypothetical protein